MFAHLPSSTFGVCDGHGAESTPDGIHLPQASEIVSTQLPPLLASGLSPSEAFLHVDRVVCAALPPRSFIGTTATVGTVRRGRILSLAHVGDSRAVLVDGNGRGCVLTEDHVPGRNDEAMRVERAGGHVLRGRVNGVLAVSRAIGARALKSVVQACPDVMERALRRDDQCLVLASDGLWDLVDADEVAERLAAAPQKRGAVAVPEDLQKAADDLVDLAVERGSRDDVSIVVVDLTVL